MMYILVLALEGARGHEIRRYVAATKAPLTERRDRLASATVAWRLHKDGWVDGSDEAWRLIQEPYGAAEVIC